MEGVSTFGTREAAAFALDARQRKAAYRALDDPVLVRRAIQITRAAIACQLVSVDELTLLPPYDPSARKRPSPSRSA